ncbi:Ectonucleotide pyrophosphatase/phosphodiesterase family member 6 [Holothuria leucospilota]|uniref:Ectonucleotide pyrophosphatase/phosphodiesterase family member 6 n=1 Tax=Holothuria leucospilota TaxID=206669 RepID=A0A9Q1BVC1_HOLLE|nr:Ectonucleotide pyrophosphatase/phosphodiesterase family member 6 [Holothuria leucospilota]
MFRALYICQDALSSIIEDAKGPIKFIQDTDRIFGSQHGYDNKHMVMKSYFMAKGPFFKEGYRANPINSVDIYGMMCEILGLEPAPNNGSRLRYVDMIRETDDPGSAILATLSLWLMLFSGFVSLSLML